LIETLSLLTFENFFEKNPLSLNGCSIDPEYKPFCIAPLIYINIIDDAEQLMPNISSHFGMEPLICELVQAKISMLELNVANPANKTNDNNSVLIIPKQSEIVIPFPMFFSGFSIFLAEITNISKPLNV
jgi:hypothetical protein